MNASQLIIPGDRKTVPAHVVTVRRSAFCGGRRAVRLCAVWRGRAVVLEEPYEFGDRESYWNALQEVVRQFSRKTGAKIEDITKGVDAFRATGRRRRVA
jgi:hypothetical protein